MVQYRSQLFGAFWIQCYDYRLAKAATQGYQSQGVFGLVGISISSRYNG